MEDHRSDMWRVWIICTLLCAAGAQQQRPDSSAREEKLRTALIDAFQAIKSKGGEADLLGAARQLLSSNVTPPSPATDDSFDRFFDEGFGLDDATEKPSSTEKTSEPSTETITERAPVVQSFIKPSTLSRRNSEPVPSRRNSETATLIGRISDGIRSAVNTTRQQLLEAERANVEGAHGVQDLLRVLDAGALLQQWNSLRGVVGAECRRDVDEYVRALMEHRLWALKMDDASGRYNSAFYWGNNYWTGSAHLCSALAKAPAATTTASDQKQHNHSESEWRHDTAMSDAGPPFATAFYILKMHLTSNVSSLIHRRRTITLGACFPATCAPSEVGAIVGALKTAPELSAQVLSVRSPDHTSYNPLHDPIFHLLAGVTAVVASLLITGTLYDLSLSRRIRRARRRAANMAASTDAQTCKMDLDVLDNVTIANGKSIYNVNNNNNSPASTSAERLTAAETTDSVEQAPVQPLQLGVWSELLLSFSVKANVLQIMDRRVGADTIPVVHGLRSISMLWIILGHACIVSFKYADNTEVRKIVEKEFVFQIVVSAVYSVDTFFCLGGLLVSFLYFRSNAKGKLERLTGGKTNLLAGVCQFVGLVAYRFARLTAPYLFMLGVVEVTMKWFHYNSVFEPPTADHETCPKYWWRNILYINTLFPVEQMCMLWSWYLSDDSQFYALSAILLILATSHFKAAAGATGVLLVSSLITTGYVSYESRHIPSAEDPLTSFDKIYDKPWTRLGPYLVGVVTGWILFKTNLRIRMSRAWTCAGWSASSLTLLFLIFGLYSVELDIFSAAAYAALSHTLWAAAVAWVIVACSTGHGGYVAKALSTPLLYPLSRVTYCAYLVHPVVIRIVAMQLDHPLHLGKLVTIVLFLGMAVLSYALAFLVSVAFEAPVVTMLKILAPHKRPHRL